MNLPKISPRDKEWWPHSYKKPVGFIVLPHSSLDVSPELDSLVTVSHNRGVQSFAWGDNTVLPVYQEKIIKKHLEDSLASGGDVLGLPVYLEVGDPEGLTPEGLFNSQDEEGNQLLWTEWKRDNYHFLERGGVFYISSKARTNSAPDISTLAPVLPLVSIRVPEQEEAQEAEN